MEDKEDEYGDYNDNEESCSGLEIVESLTDAGKTEAVKTDKLFLMYCKRVGRGVRITLGLKDKESVAVIDILNTVRIQYALAVDDSPISNDIAGAKILSINLGRNNKVAIVDSGLH